MKKDLVWIAALMLALMGVLYFLDKHTHFIDEACIHDPMFFLRGTKADCDHGKLPA